MGVAGFWAYNPNQDFAGLLFVMILLLNKPAVVNCSPTDILRLVKAFVIHVIMCRSILTEFY